MPYVLSQPARRDMGRIADEIARTHGRRAADSMIDRVTAAFVMLGEHPKMGRDRSDELGSGLRSAVSGLCVIVYRPIGDSVRILRVFDGRRDYPVFFRT